MLEVLQFVFQDFWHWAGSVIILGVVGGAFGAAINRVYK